MVGTECRGSLSLSLSLEFPTGECSGEPAVDLSLHTLELPQSFEQGWKRTVREQRRKYKFRRDGARVTRTARLLLLRRTPRRTAQTRRGEPEPPRAPAASPVSVSFVSFGHAPSISRKASQASATRRRYSRNRRRKPRTGTSAVRSPLSRSAPCARPSTRARAARTRSDVRHKGTFFEIQKRGERSKV